MLGKNQSPHPLSEAVEQLPNDWRYTLVGSNKCPIVGEDWQKRSFTKQEVKEALKNGFDYIKDGKTTRKPGSAIKAIGVLCGVVSGGLLCIDHDGASADALIEKKADCPVEVALPKTVGFTSGRPGRYQLAYRVPEEYWEAIVNRRIRADTDKEQIELRWNGQQSVVMGAHPDTEGYRWLPGQSPEEIAEAEAPMWAIEQMLKKEDEPPKPRQKPQPSETCKSSDEEIARSALNALHPSRADDYDSWVKVGQCLRSVSDALFADWDEWSKQSAKYKSKGMKKKWESFKGSGLSLGTLIKWAQEDGWKYPKSDRQQFTEPSTAAAPDTTAPTNVVDHPTVGNGMEELMERLKAIHSSVSGSNKRLQIADLAKHRGYQVRDLERIYDDLERELDVEDGRSDNQQNLTTLIDARQSSIPLATVLPGKLAEPLEQLAQWQSLRPEVYLFSLLGGVSSLHRNGTNLVLHRAMDFRVSPGLFFGLVADSGQKKSPVIKAALRKPLGSLHSQERERHEEAIAEWKDRCSKIRQGDKNAELPEEPRRRLYFFNRTTGEAILRQAARQPGHGLTYLVDELKALFASQNVYRRGHGSDAEDLLEFYDGNGGVTLRTDGVRDDVDFLNLAIVGSIQPRVLQKLIGEGDDSNGQWARFIFVHQPSTPSTLPDDDGGGIDLTRLLAGLYRDIDSIQKMEYQLSKQAFKRFQATYDELEQKRVSEPSPAMRAVWGKTAGRIGKLAMNLHVIRWAMSTDRSAIPPEKIELETIGAAIALAKFAAQQIRSLYCEMDDGEGNMAPHLMKVLELAERHDLLRAKTVVNAFTKSKRPTSETVREWFCELEKMGYGSTVGTGRNLNFQKVDKVDTKVDKVSTSKTPTDREFQPLVDKVDNFLKNNQVGESPPDLPTLSTSPPTMSDGGKKSISPKLSTLSTFDQKDCETEVSAVDKKVDTPSTFSKSSTNCPDSAPPNEAIAPRNSDRSGVTIHAKVDPVLEVIKYVEDHPDPEINPGCMLSKEFAQLEQALTNSDLNRAIGILERSMRGNAKDLLQILLRDRSDLFERLCQLVFKELANEAG